MNGQQVSSATWRACFKSTTTCSTTGTFFGPSTWTNCSTTIYYRSSVNDYPLVRFRKKRNNKKVPSFQFKKKEKEKEKEGYVYSSISFVLIISAMYKSTHRTERARRYSTETINHKTQCRMIVLCWTTMTLFLFSLITSNLHSIHLCIYT